MFKRKKEAVIFTDRVHSIKGIISLCMGLISGISFMVLAYVSSLSQGNGSMLLGFAGMTLFFLSLVGFYLGFNSCKEKEIYYTAPVAGVFVNGVCIIVYFTLYIIGISL
jgi:hypothetical protein